MSGDLLRQRIRQRLEDLSIAQAEVGRRTGWPPNFLSDLLHGRKASVRPDNLRRLAEALETTTAYLKGTTDVPNAPPAGSTGVRRGAQAMSPYRLPTVSGIGAIALPFHAQAILRKDVLVEWRDAYDGAVGIVPFFVDRDESEVGAVLTRGTPPLATPTVPAIAALQGGYAVMMPDESMRPAFPAGWALFAAPRSVSLGTNVIVRSSNPSGASVLLVRQLLDAGPDQVSVMSLADGNISTLERGEGFTSVHPILATMADPEIL
jgi:transcriptional regulator with XRE-family HTH domain